MLIRHADSARDAAACAAIYAPFVTGSAVSFEEEPPGATQMGARIERISLAHPWLVAEEGGLRAEEDVLVAEEDVLVAEEDALVAEEDGPGAEQDTRIAGFAYAAPHRQRPAYRWAADVSVYVAEDMRGRGIGGALYRALLELLVRQGIHVACAGITLPNDASVALHESLGFVQIGTYRRIGFKSGAWRDVGWWELELLAAGEAEPDEPGPPARLGEG